MKTPSDDLFTLIKSLDTREKGFFKVFSAKRSFHKKELSYLKLFDSIDKLKYYDESLLLSRLKKIGFKHHLQKAKNYLIKAIHNSLREYHSNASVHAELQQFLHLTDIFIKKGLNGMARKTLLKAEKLALEHELYDYLIAICSLKTNVLGSIKKIKDMEVYLGNGIQQEKKYLAHLTNTLEFKNLAFRMRLITATYSKAKGKERHRLKSILRSPLLSSPGRALSFFSLQDYYSIHLSCSRLLDTWNTETYQRQKDWLHYLEADKEKIAERTHSYFAALINLMLIQIKMDKIDQADISYEKIKRFYFSVPSKNRTKVLLSEFVGTTFNYMGAQFEKGKPEKALKIWEQIQDSISLNNLDHNMLLGISNNLSHSYFALGNYHSALTWANKILNFREKNMLDIQAMTRIYLLVLHYELGNYDTLSYLARSLKRFLLKHNYFFEFEKIIVSFFEKKIHRAIGQKKQTEAFAQLKTDLGLLFKNNKHIRALEHFDYISWIESKTENRLPVDAARVSNTQ